MGIKKGLRKFLFDKAGYDTYGISNPLLEDLHGYRVAIDANNMLHHCLEAPLSSAKTGSYTGHFYILLSWIVRWTSVVIRPAFVFDGKPPALKETEINRQKHAGEERAKNQKLAEEGQNTDCNCGECTVEAPSEAEAQCVQLCKAKKVYAVVSDDTDCYPLSAPKLFSNFYTAKKGDIIEQFEIEKILARLALHLDQFIDLCIICGCDYGGGVEEVDIEEAWDLIKEHKSIEHIMKIKSWSLPNYEQIRKIYKEPNVKKEAAELIWGSPKDEKITAMLVEKCGFDAKKVQQDLKLIKEAIQRSRPRQKQNRPGSQVASINLNAKRIQDKKDRDSKARDKNERKAQESKNKSIESFFARAIESRLASMKISLEPTERKEEATPQHQTDSDPVDSVIWTKVVGMAEEKDSRCEDPHKPCVDSVLEEKKRDDLVLGYVEKSSNTGVRVDELAVVELADYLNLPSSEIKESIQRLEAGSRVYTLYDSHEVLLYSAS